MRHALRELNIDLREAECVTCGHTRIVKNGLLRGHTNWVCLGKIQARDLARRLKGSKFGESYRRYKRDYCESPACCWQGPFTVEMLDVDHVDGNHKNNARDNLWTLCSNCHRAKTRNQKLKPTSPSSAKDSPS